MLTYNTKNSKETHNVAIEIGKQLKAGDVIAFRGGLGAGKTTFTRGMAEGLGLNADVSSPTFAIVNEYRGELITLYHFDMYRVSDFDSLYSTGFFDYLDSEKGILAIEWSENIQAELPDDTIFISLEVDSENFEHRQIKIEGGRF